MKGKIIFWGIATTIVAGWITISYHRNLQMENYAKANSCEWRATGSFYGDDRDFICVKNGENK